MSLRPFLLFLAVMFVCSLHGQTSKHEGRFHIQQCTSGVDYPDKGNESVDIDYGDRTYHVRIYHPKVVVGPHFSSPFFWVSEKGKKDSYNSDFIALRSHIQGLAWRSIKGYFFAEKNGKLRGFFLEDGWDNADNGASGLLLLHDGNKSSAWNWWYTTSTGRKKREFQITDENDPCKQAPASLLKRIAPILDHAKVQANGWPGP